MTFFNKKEEVMDIELTRFGRDSLARGSFRPAFYQFFDDDILYDASCMGFSEGQNDSEKRILEETPRLKTQSITYPIEKAFALEAEMIESGQMEKFRTISRNADPVIQERILLYPIHSYNIKTSESPRIKMQSHFQKMKSEISYLHLTESGIIKNIPQISFEPEYAIRENRENLREPGMLNQETYVDLSSRNAEFLDGSTISVTSKDIVVSLEEINSFYGLDNFEIEVYEVIEVDGMDDTLLRLETMEEINKYFHIKTDDHVPLADVPDLKHRNYYKKGES